MLPKSYCLAVSSLLLVHYEAPGTRSVTASCLSAFIVPGVEQMWLLEFLGSIIGSVQSIEGIPLAKLILEFQSIYTITNNIVLDDIQLHCQASSIYLIGHKYVNKFYYV